MYLYMGLFEKPSYVVSYPFSNSNSKYGPVAKLGLLFLACVLFIPFFTVVGYGFRVLENAINRDQMPRVKEPLQLTKEGLIALLVLFPVTIVTSALNVAATEVGGVVAVVSAITLLIAGYITPIITGLHAKSRTLFGTYNTAKIIEIATSKRYLLGVTGYFVFQILLSFVVTFAMIFIPLIPFIIAFFVIVQNAYLGAILADEFESDGRLA